MLIGGIAVVLTACGGGGEVVVFAASSAVDVLTGIEQAYRVERDSAEVVVSVGGSSTLREQILSGAPAAVFLSADRSTMAPVVAAGLVIEGPVVVAETTLVIAVPATNPGGVSALRDLEDHALLVGLCAVHVPCGVLARAALTDAGVTVAADTEEPSARTLLAKVVAGELDAALVYRTDALSAGDAVEMIEIPEAADHPARYHVALLDESGADFYWFLLSPEGRRVFADHGFTIP